VYKFLWGLTGLLAGFLAYQARDWVLLDRRNPVRFVDAEATNSPIVEGQNLGVVIYREKVRDDCPVTSIRNAQNADGRLIPLAGEVWPGGPIGDSLYFEYPTGILPPGNYTLKVDLIYSCPGDQTFYHHQPDVTFRVLPKGPKDAPQGNQLNYSPLQRNLSGLDGEADATRASD